jgi:hypothetical protein
MPSEESPEARFDRLKRQLQDSILRDYPNPERKGCPGDAVLRRLAEKPLDQPVDGDPNWEHVTHCAECYREFLAFNTAHRERAKARQARFTWTVAALAVIVLIGVVVGFQRGLFSPKRPQNAEVAYVRETVDIPSMQRSVDTEEPRAIVLERKPLELTVNLPVGSKAGRYELELKKSDKTLFSTSSDTEIRNGTTSFTAKLDLSRFDPGNYSMYVRQLPFDWNYYPVVIR